MVAMRWSSSAFAAASIVDWSGMVSPFLFHPLLLMHLKSGWVKAPFLRTARVTAGWGVYARKVN